jgi:DNA primase
MPPVSVELKKQVKAANDIVDVVATYIPVSAAGKVFKAVCPFHNDHRPSLQLDRHYQNFRCWACDAKGDVFDFVMRFDKVEFPEALRMLADRAGIALDTTANPQDELKSRLLRVMKWAETTYQQCLLEEPIAAPARTYLGDRKLSGTSVRQFGLGFAPLPGDWLVKIATEQRIPFELLTEVGLIAPRDGDRGFFDRFRDRVMFPIRDVRGQTVGFGGRILPDSPYAARGPKYYNSAETPLFHKSELIYGLDLARHPASAAGHIAVVEGYTDVMMAHQCGVANVVATMGTALTLTHVTQLRRYAPRVVLVYDADAGGMNGVDRALELFVSQDVELAVATLPDGLDPCDLLMQPGGVDVFTHALKTAQDALEFKLNLLWEKESGNTSVEAMRRIVDAILGIMALAPPVPSQAGQMRQELIVTRVAHRLGLRQERVWARLAELKAERRSKEQQRAAEERRAETRPLANANAPIPRAASGQQVIERQLLELLLAEPALVPDAYATVPPETLTHTGLRRMLEELYALHAAGESPDLDALRVRLIDRPDLAESAMRLQEVGRSMTERPAWLGRIIDAFARLVDEAARSDVKREMAAATDDDTALALLKRLQGGGK